MTDSKVEKYYDGVFMLELSDITELDILLQKTASQMPGMSGLVSPPTNTIFCYFTEANQS
ncbi:MAG TPA: hypothetical protein VGM41_18355 [Chitinophagaceae bacterium]